MKYFSTNVVAFPRYLNIPNITPKVYLDNVHGEKCKMQIYPMVMFPFPIDDEGQGDPGFRLLMKNPKYEDTSMDEKEKAEYSKEFVQFTKDLDTIRNTNIYQRYPTERII